MTIERPTLEQCWGCHRNESNDPDLRMPPVARNFVDENGTEIIEA